jgi:hypothetical protein
MHSKDDQSINNSSKKTNYKTSYIRRRVQSFENNIIHAEMPEMVIIIVINYLLSRNQKLIFHDL